MSDQNPNLPDVQKGFNFSDVLQEMDGLDLPEKKRLAVIAWLRQHEKAVRTIFEELESDYKRLEETVEKFRRIATGAGDIAFIMASDDEDGAAGSEDGEDAEIVTGGQPVKLRLVGGDQ